jgi:hypothetical protein
MKGSIPASPISNHRTSTGFKLIQSSVENIFGFLCAPYLWIGKTDTRWHWGLSESIFRWVQRETGRFFQRIHFELRRFIDFFPILCKALDRVNLLGGEGDRLEIENKNLKKQIDATVVAPAPAPTNNDTARMVDEATVKALKNEIEQLQAHLKNKFAATAKLASGKDKLESYTNKTLSKF